MPVSVTDRQDRISLPRDLLRAVKRAVATALVKAGAPPNALVDVSLVDDDQIRSLNRDYRGVDAATDVLSFALNEGHDGWPDDPARELLGDVIVSLPRAAAQAAEYGHSLRRELCFLAVHGTLHLLGHDHRSPEQERPMRALEEEILAALGLQR